MEESKELQGFYKIFRTVVYVCPCCWSSLNMPLTLQCSTTGAAY